MLDRTGHAAATALHDCANPAPIFCPVNEISFLAWAACESTFIHPHRGALGPEASARGFALKKRLVRAAIAGCDAIRAVIPAARLMHIDPLVYIVAPADDPSRADEAAHVRSFQFQAWDMLTGRLAPELGGAPHYVDIVGVNYYHGNQFDLATEKRLHWHVRNPRRIPLRSLLQETSARYEKPLLVAETSDFGVGRDRWIVVLDGRDAFAPLYRSVLGANVAWCERNVRVESNVGRDAALVPFFDAFDDRREPLGYPLRGGTQALIDGLLPLLDGELVRGGNVVRILPRERSVVLDCGRRVRYERLIVTLPLPTLVALCDDVPDDVTAAARRLRTLSLRACV